MAVQTRSLHSDSPAVIPSPHFPWRTIVCFFQSRCAAPGNHYITHKCGNHNSFHIRIQSTVPGHLSLGPVNFGHLLWPKQAGVVIKTHTHRSLEQNGELKNEPTWMALRTLGSHRQNDTVPTVWKCLFPFWKLLLLPRLSLVFTALVDFKCTDDFILGGLFAQLLSFRMFSIFIHVVTCINTSFFSLWFIICNVTFTI